MDHHSKENSTSVDSQTDPRENRRNLLKGIAGAPVILSIASRPAWGSECSLSGTLSGNLSDHRCRVLGRSPDFWQNPQNLKFWANPSNYPGTGSTPGTAFNIYPADLFATAFGSESLFGSNFTLIVALDISKYFYQSQVSQVQLINPPWGGSAVFVSDSFIDIDRQAIAALLNAASPVVDYPLTVTQVIDRYQNAYHDCATLGNLAALSTLEGEFRGYNTTPDETNVNP